MGRLNAPGMALVLALLGACAAPPPAGLPAPPRITSFTADAFRITAGQAVTLTWTAENASSVKLEDQAGTAVVLTGSAEAGSATVTPTLTRFYVLRVQGEGGQDSAFLQVAVDEDLREVFLVAVPEVVDAGERASLIWSAPGARSARLESTTGETHTLDASKGSGVLDLRPEKSATWSLVATGTADEPLTAQTELLVRPTVRRFEALPGAARPGGGIELQWETRGAASVSLSEATFGTLFTAPNDKLEAGAFTWTVPAQLPGGAAVLEGQRLHFTLTVAQERPAVTVTRELESYVGDPPRLLEVLAPRAVTRGRTFDLGWRTQNATRLQVFADGALVYQPLSTNLGDVRRGTVRLQAPTVDTTYRIVAFSHLGAVTSETLTIRVVEPPEIDSFTLQPSVSNLGDPAAASWTTTHAARVILRVANGANLHVTSDESSAAAGSASLYPGMKLDVTLEAWNDAGDRVSQTKTVDVGSSATFTAGPTPTVQDLPVTVSWNVPSAAAPRMIGDPRQVPTKNDPPTSFVDLSEDPAARQVVFDDADDDLQPLHVDAAFRFPFAGLLADRFQVSTNGFVTFGDLADPAAALPSMIAPFWDDLELGASGRVLYLVQGSTFPRRLIIQWDGVRGSDPAATLTFQLQLYETGEFHFGYPSLTGPGSGGQDAHIGWRRDEHLASALSTGIVQGDEYVWFAGGTAQGTWTHPPQAPSVYTLFAPRTQGGHLVFATSVNVIPEGAVTINEVMASPGSVATKGQWLELHNETAKPVDLSGTVLTTEGLQTSFTLPGGTILPPGGHLLCGESTDPNETGGAPVELVWGTVVLQPLDPDVITLSAGEVISRFEYSAADIAPGTSIQRADRAITDTGAPLSCPRTQTYGANGGVGTPGTRNESCFEYVLDAIPVAWRDISTTGTPVFGSGSVNLVHEFRNGVDVSTAPIPFYGTRYATLNVAVNGFVSLLPIANSADNMDLPRVIGSRGLIAPFWDMLARPAGGDGNVYLQRFEAGEDLATPGAHWVVQWDRLTHYEFLGNPNDGELSFQAKLFDDGTIEFHYAELRNGSVGFFSKGESATVWVERPDSSAALPLLIREPRIAPWTAWRYSPKSQVTP